ncbi:helix-turn-helix domain-containing protein [Brevundimonas sp.]|uniref:helix-turn-helix domain-containing protein n=1 Tax=Brevundimonas sp. TaxID=1871086 RepID=UPI0035AFEB49
MRGRGRTGLPSITEAVITPSQTTARSPHPFDVEIGRRVREVRIRAGLSQSQLAAAIGVSFQQVQKYENGANRFSASKLAQAATFLGVEAGALFQDLPGDGEISGDLRPMSRTAIKVAEIVGGLSPAKQRIILNLATELRDGG